MARTRSCFRDSKDRLVYVGQGHAYVMWLGIPSQVIIGLNHRCSSVMETQLTVHHRSINNWNLNKACEGVGYKVS